MLRDDGFELDDKNLQLVSILKACKYVNHAVTVCLPIQRGMLRMLLDQIEEKFLNMGQEFLCKHYRAMIVTAYYGLFRVGEITLSPHVIKFIDVHSTGKKDKILFVLRTSKTHQISSKPQ